MKKQYTIKDPKEQATKRQLWFLHILTKEDTRDWKLTKGEAAKKIADLKKNGKPKREYLGDYTAPVTAKPAAQKLKVKPPNMSKAVKTGQKKSAPAPKTPPKASQKPKAARKQGRARKEPARPDKGEKEPAIDKPKKMTVEQLTQMGAIAI